MITVGAQNFYVQSLSFRSKVLIMTFRIEFITLQTYFCLFVQITNLVYFFLIACFELLTPNFLLP